MRPERRDPTPPAYVALHKALSRERQEAIARAVQAMREKEAAIALVFLDRGQIGPYIAYLHSILKKHETH